MPRSCPPARVLLYEWCMSGGLAGGDAAIAHEGRMMLEALAADAAKEPAFNVTVLVESGRSIDVPVTVRVASVPHGGDTESLVAAAQAHDWTLIVAPETDGILTDRARAVRAAGGRVLAPGDRVIETASDKQATIDALAARGIPLPAGRALAAGESIPPCFRMPAVRKARRSCGGDGLEILSSCDWPPAPGPTRLEALARGVPIGVSCICGPRSVGVLPPMRQIFTDGPAPRYLGSELVADEECAARARALAIRAATALGADAGWLGVDMILGARPDGRDDRVLEVNPRVTTSFVGQSRLFASSLVAAMIGAAASETPALLPTTHPVPAAGGFRLADA